jgi:hypothetical protein
MGRTPETKRGRRQRRKAWTRRINLSRERRALALDANGARACVRRNLDGVLVQPCRIAATVESTLPTSDERGEMANDAQKAQHELIEQALADPRVADAVRAYEAVRPFVPEQSWVPVATSYTASSRLTLGLPPQQ